MLMLNAHTHPANFLAALGKRWRRIAWSLMFGITACVAVAWTIAVFASPNSSRLFTELIGQGSWGTSEWVGDRYTSNTTDIDYVYGQILMHPPATDTSRGRNNSTTAGPSPWVQARLHDIDIDVSGLTDSYPGYAPFENGVLFNRQQHEFICDARGWPMRSFAAYWAQPNDASAFRIPPANLKWGHQLPFKEMTLDPSFTSFTLPRALPLRPLWRGFIINSAFYAVIFYTVASVILWIRRIRRRSGNQCPTCGYDLKGLPNRPCPECGASTTPRKQTQTRCKVEHPASVCLLPVHLEPMRLDFLGAGERFAALRAVCQWIADRKVVATIRAQHVRMRTQNPFDSAREPENVPIGQAGSQ